ncbi:MAG: CAP domain-containing protein [Thermoanaerobaculia bacterium]
MLAVITIILPSSINAENRSHERTAADAIVAAMNRERTARGLRPLRLNTRLSLAATDRIDDMFAKNYFAHVSPDGLQPFVWARARGYRYRLIGENLAVGYRGTTVVDGWMRSPAHRDNILQRGFDEVGIAIADGAPRRGYRGPTVVAMYGASTAARW